MKKYKEKINKKELGQRSGLRPWMTILGVMGTVGLIVGATVLGVFLTGGFEEKIVTPESISFEYDEKLFNKTYSQIEISDSHTTGEFSLTINSPTEGVTENKINLSFENSEKTTTIGGLISNTIIQVPQVVTIGQPFSVKLLKEQLEVEPGKFVDWIKGGISVLKAQSENEDVPSTELKIAVDTPVYSTKTIVYDSNKQIAETDDAGNYVVLTGEAFDPTSHQ